MRLSRGHSLLDSPHPAKPGVNGGTRILIADDLPIFRYGLRKLFEGERDLHVIGEAGDGVEALDRMRRLNPDMLLLAVTLPSLSGLDVLRHLSTSPERV